MGSRGRPAYQSTDKDGRIVEMLAGWAIPHERIAMVVGIDAKTLRKHYRERLDHGSAKLEAQLAQNLLRIAQGHDRQALIATIFALKSRFGWIEATPSPREAPLGKKEARQLAADTISDRFKPSKPPLAYRSTYDA